MSLIHGKPVAVEAHMARRLEMLRMAVIDNLLKTCEEDISRLVRRKWGRFIRVVSEPAHEHRPRYHRTTHEVNFHPHLRNDLYILTAPNSLGVLETSRELTRMVDSSHAHI